MIAGPAFPNTLHIYAEDGREETIIKPRLSFDELYRLRYRFRFPADRKKFSSAIVKRGFCDLY